jgi:hypothetical protein
VDERGCYRGQSAASARQQCFKLVPPSSKLRPQSVSRVVVCCLLFLLLALLLLYAVCCVRCRCFLWCTSQDTPAGRGHSPEPVHFPRGIMRPLQLYFYLFQRRLHCTVFVPQSIHSIPPHLVELGACIDAPGVALSFFITIRSSEKCLCRLKLQSVVVHLRSMTS